MQWRNKMNPRITEPENNTMLHAHLKDIQALFDAYQQTYFMERPPEFFALELCGEAGELANLEKKRWKGKEIAHTAIADEAADVFIALMNFANARSIDLAQAVCDKIQRIEHKRTYLAEQGEQY
jgi:NTP pyrophosphatase (non-canonical NTP hydrolase)